MIQRLAKTRIRNAVVFSVALFFLTAPVVSQESGDPWSTLEGVRASMLKAGPIAASFSMTDVPAGSSKGESESGRVAIALPGCIRWDYQQPRQKSFLVCDGMEYYWNDEDNRGSRRPHDYEKEPDLSFLLVEIDSLKRDYYASSRSVAGGLEISLTHKRGLAYISDAVLTVDSKSERIIGVSYHDMEGNFTRFIIEKYYALGNRSLFSPPANIEWDRN